MGISRVGCLVVGLATLLGACKKESSNNVDLASGDLASVDLTGADLANDATPSDSAVAADLTAVDLYVPVATLTLDRQPTYNFGDVVAGVPSGTITFTVTNTGPDASGALAAATVTGTGAAAFTISSDGCVGKILGLNDTCYLQVFAQSNTPGSVSATLSTSATPGSTATVNLTATILAAGSISADSSSAPFGSVQVGTTKDVTITLTNDGGSETGSLSFGFSGGGASEFTIVGGTCSTSTKLAATDSCTVIVRWTPLAVASRSVTLTVSASPGGPVAVNMTGSSYTAASLGFASGSYTPTPNNPVDKGGSVTIDLTLHNYGTQDSGPLPALQTMIHTAFTVTGGSCQAGNPIPGLSSCTIQVTFSPTAFGAASDSISVTASPGGTASTTLSATGRETFKLTVTRLGTGTGTISVDGTPCSSYPCTVDYPVTTVAPSVAIVATTDVSSTFGGWTTTPNVVACAADTTCTVTMDRNRGVDPTFTLKTFTVTVDLTAIRGATGVVTADVAPQLVCNTTTCTGTYGYGSNVTLTAAPTNDNLFQSWSAAPCSASKFSTTCATGVLTANFTTAVTFRPKINYAFVSSKEINVSTIGADLVNADRFCDGLARDAGLVNTPEAPAAPYFKALLATTAASARSRIASAKGWIRPDGREFASDPNDIFQQGGSTKPAQTFYPLSVTETLGSSGIDYAATGSDGTGAVVTGSNCNDWTTDLGCGAGATLGDPRASGDLWLFRQVNCGCAEWRIYCFETAQPPTAIAPPVPAQKRTVFVSSGTFAGGTNRDTADTLCSTEASNAGLPGTFVSLLPVTNEAASARLDTGLANWVRVDNVPIATSTTNFINALWQAPIAQLANGTYVLGFTPAWVGGSSPAAVLSSDSQTCKSWTVATGSSGYMLSAGSPGYYWSSQACSTASRVLCVQQ